MGRKETEIGHAVMLAAPEYGAVLWRNNVGTFRAMYNDAKIRCGLPTGSGDYVGMMPDGRFLSVETKTEKGRIQDNQIRWRDMINKRGGVAFIARSVDEFREKIKSHLRTG